MQAQPPRKRATIAIAGPACMGQYHARTDPSGLPGRRTFYTCLNTRLNEAMAYRRPLAMTEGVLTWSAGASRRTHVLRPWYTPDPHPRGLSQPFGCPGLRIGHPLQRMLSLLEVESNGPRIEEEFARAKPLDRSARVHRLLAVWNGIVFVVWIARPFLLARDPLWGAPRYPTRRPIHPLDMPGSCFGALRTAAPEDATLQRGLEGYVAPRGGSPDRGRRSPCERGFRIASALDRHGRTTLRGARASGHGGGRSPGSCPCRDTERAMMPDAGEDRRRRSPGPPVETPRPCIRPAKRPVPPGRAGATPRGAGGAMHRRRCGT